MGTSPLAPTVFELCVGIYSVTVFAALFAAVWALATKRISRSEAVLAVVATVAVPVVGSVAVLGWLFAVKAQRKPAMTR